VNIRIEQWVSIEELALMSIGTDKGTWWADPDFGSELWLLKKEGKVDGQTAGKPEPVAPGGFFARCASAHLYAKNPD
jgi:hypothetical protein